MRVWLDMLDMDIEGLESYDCKTQNRVYAKDMHMIMICMQKIKEVKRRSYQNAVATCEEN